MSGLHPKTLFLLDSLGALLSAFLLGVVLVQYKSRFGMPEAILYILAITALILFLYSLTCYLWFPKNWQRFIGIVAVLNILYCITTGVMVIIYYERLTVLGYLYFTAEISLIIVLALFEFKMARRS